MVASRPGVRPRILVLTPASRTRPPLVSVTETRRPPLMGGCGPSGRFARQPPLRAELRSQPRSSSPCPRDRRAPPPVSGRRFSSRPGARQATICVPTPPPYHREPARRRPHQAEHCRHVLDGVDRSCVSFRRTLVPARAAMRGGGTPCGGLKRWRKVRELGRVLSPCFWLIYSPGPGKRPAYRPAP